jgi:multiple sugar transport system permease protein
MEVLDKKVIQNNIHKKITPNNRKRNRINKADYKWGYLFIGVPILVFLVFTAYPLISAFIISFQKYKPLGSDWVGLQNYATLLKDSLFFKSILNTIIYTIGAVPVNLFISFVLALLIFPLRKWAQTFFKAVYYLPAIASGVTTSLVWLWIYQPLPGGLLNKLVSIFGVESQNWLGSSKTAMLSLLIMTWLSSHGVSVIVYLAALGGIPEDLFEVADLDGASFFQKIRYIVLPLLKPTTLFLGVTGVISSFQVFANAYLMTGGGPDNATNTVGLLIFQNAFTYANFGAASAEALVLTVVIALVAALQFKYMGSDVEY